ncbi:MAG: hypothetical protein FJ125_07090 [Deltaproteobacteria bacterium]|nr:hypothetical protein [Deltaproteobacteria bacterium]
MPADRPQDYGGWCGPTLRCNPQVSGADYQNCLAEQCKGVRGEAGVCLGGYCTRRCSVPQDCRPSPGNTWVDGPQGDDFSCYGSQQLAFCFPGSTTECMGDSECPDGETCQIGYSKDFQHLIGLCLTNVKCGGDGGEFCNDDITTGDLVACKNAFCWGNSCAKLCVDDAECDWSDAVYCRKDMQLGGDSFPNDFFNVCFGKLCEKDADCGAEDYWCNPLSLNDAGDDLEGFCDQVSPPDGASYGEPCNDDPLDAVPDIACGRGLCIGGYCGSGCEENIDCLEGFACYEIDICISEWDDVRQRCLGDSVPQGFCIPWPGTMDECRTDEDCTTAGEHCALFSADEETGEIDFKCKEDEAGGNELGEDCGGPRDIPCYNDLCLAVPGQVGYCSKWCETNLDCGEGFICDDIAINEEGTLTTKVCWEWEGSAAECDVDGDCPQGEHCAMSNLDRETGMANFRCRTNIEDGVDFGDQCGGPQDIACYNDLCLAAEGRPGYCSKPCTATADCGPGFLCLSLPVTEEGDVEAKFCLEMEGSLEDCAGDFVCPNGERCTPVPEDEAVSFLCTTSEGEVAAGEECATYEECVSQVCLVAGGEDSYCSTLCNDQVPCPANLGSCVQQPIEEGDDPRTIGLCTRAAQCHLCSEGIRCAGDFTCHFNMVELPDEPEPIVFGTCVKPCVGNADCQNVRAGDAATSCRPLAGPDGQPTEAKGCTSNDMPTDCGFLRAQ